MHLWKIALDGNRLDLEAIVLWFPNGGVHGVQEESGSEKCYFLVGTSFDQIQEAALVHERACGALDEISAAISLLDLNFENQGVGIPAAGFFEESVCALPTIPLHTYQRAKQAAARSQSAGTQGEPIDPRMLSAAGYGELDPIAGSNPPGLTTSQDL